MRKKIIPAIIVLISSLQIQAQTGSGYIPDSNFNKEKQLSEIVVTANRSG